MCHEFLPLSFDSILPHVDKIIFVWGMECNKTKEILDKYIKQYPDKIILIESKYDQKYKGQNGKQRNIYLQYLKKNFNNEFALVCDPDEIIDDNFLQFAKMLKTLEDDSKFPEICSIKMRHTIGDLSHEDSTINIHFVPHRLFKIREDLYYPETEHPVLSWKNDRIKNIGYITQTTIWHLSYSRQVFDIKKKYDTHINKSEMHNPDFLRWWYTAHIYGEYPNKKFSPIELPKIIKDFFYINDDELYFKDRNLEVKHWIDIVQWKNHFKPKTMLDIGCGFGMRTWIAQTYGINSFGIDKSKWAIENSLFRNLIKEGHLVCDDITRKGIEKSDFDLIVAYDILEHIKYEDIDIVLDNIYNLGKENYLFSIPFIMDNNLYQDNTHIIKESKEWWLNKLQQHNFKIQMTPHDFQFAKQIIIAKK